MRFPRAAKHFCLAWQVLACGIIIVRQGSALRQAEYTSVSAQKQKQKAEKTASGTRVKFTTIGKQMTPVVEVLLNENVPARFLVDTGSPSCYISPAVAQKLGLPLQQAPESTGDNKGLPGKGSMVAIPKVHLGDVVLDPLYVRVWPEKGWSPAKEGLDGILGAPLFNICPVAIDFVRHEMDVLEPGSKTDTYVDGFKGGRASILDVELRGGYFFVKARFDDLVEESMMVDTGSAITIISKRLAKQLRVQADPLEYRARTFYGVRSCFYANVHKLTIGGETVYNAQVAILDPEIKQLPQILGLDVLADHYLFFDVPSRKLYIMRTGPAGLLKH